MLIRIDTNFLVIEVNGIGYRCFTDNYTLNKLHSYMHREVKLYTSMIVREDAVVLFAFLDNVRLDCFKNLLSVSGVGSKAALSILSEFSPEQISMLITSNDSQSLTKAHGLGKKLAQRIVLELRDKFKLNDNMKAMGANLISASNNVSEAAKALSVLGYSNSDVIPILTKLDSSLSVETLIREVLKSIG